MDILSDCHLHTSFSGDSEAPMEDMIRRGLDLGLKTMCFTEHMDFDFVYTEEEPEGFFEVDTDAYQDTFLRLKEKYAGEIELLFGIELGMQTGCTEKNTDYTKRYDFDFIIASSHLCNGKDPYLRETFFDGRSEEKAYHEYFRYIYDCIQSFQNFDIYGHLDYVLRYGPQRNRNFTYAEYAEDIDRVLRRLIELGKGIEVNSSGYPYGMGGPHPNREILSRYLCLGGEILTIGSDAHAPEQIAGNFDLVRKLLLDIGFKRYCIFKNRSPIFYPL